MIFSTNTIKKGMKKYKNIKMSSLPGNFRENGFRDFTGEGIIFTYFSDQRSSLFPTANG